MNPQDRIDRARQELREVETQLVEALSAEKSRRRAPFVRLLHEVRGMLTPARPYASQAGQDQVVDRLLGGMTGGTFLDVGAYDGVTGSNSLFFEKWRGWTGVMVEPVARHRAQAERMRAAPCLPYAIASERGSAEFIVVNDGYTQMSGLSETYDESLLQRVRNDPRHREELVTVQTRTLIEVIEEAGIATPDFVSLDIEGGELAALESFPFERMKPRTWSIENNSGGPEVANLMRSHGYRIAEFCGPDEIYVLRENT